MLDPSIFERRKPILKEGLRSGIVWSGAARAIQRVTAFILTILLARLLLPETFGLIAMVAVFTGFAREIADFNFSMAIIQRPKLDPLQVNSVFWINVAVGILFGGLLFSGASLIAGFYGESLLEPVAKVLSAVFLVDGLGAVPKAMLLREMAFNRLAFADILSTCLAGFVAILMALTGYGIWSLVSQSLLTAFTLTGLLWLLCEWRPRWMFDLRAVKEIASFSGNLTGFNVVNYWARNADNLLVGRLIGSSALGLYSRSYSLMVLPISELIAVIRKVMFPVLSAIQDDTERVKHVYLRTNEMVTFIAFPAMFGLLVVAEPFVQTAYGEMWSGMVPILKILCVVGIIQTILNPTGWLYVSQGRTDRMFRWGLGSSAVIVMAIFLGATLGSPVAVAWCYLFANLALLYPCVAMAGKLIDLRMSEVIQAVGPSFGCSGLMAIFVWIVGLMLPDTLSSSLVLVVQIATGVLSYCVLLRMFRLRVLREFQTTICRNQGRVEHSWGRLPREDSKLISVNRWAK